MGVLNHLPHRVRDSLHPKLGLECRATARSPHVAANESAALNQTANLHQAANIATLNFQESFAHDAFQQFATTATPRPASGSAAGPQVRLSTLRERDTARERKRVGEQEFGC